MKLMSLEGLFLNSNNGKHGTLYTKCISCGGELIIQDLGYVGLEYKLTDDGILVLINDPMETLSPHEDPWAKCVSCGRQYPSEHHALRDNVAVMANVGTVAGLTTWKNAYELSSADTSTDWKRYWIREDRYKYDDCGRIIFEFKESFHNKRSG